MVVALGRKPTLIKPSLGVGLDFGHPLTSGLVFCALFNQGAGGVVYDLTGNPNHRLTPSGTPVSWQAGLDGGPATSLSGTGFWTTGGAPSDAPFLGAITIVFRGKLNVNDGQLVGKHIGTGVTANPFDFSNPGASVDLYFVRGNTAARTWRISGGLVVGKQGTWAVSSPDGILETVPAFYSNGVRLPAPTSGAAGTGQCTGGSHPIRFGRREDAASQVNGQYDYVLIYNRALTDSEHHWLANEPYCFMVAVSPYRRYFISPAYALDLSAYRWRDDDNNEALASYLAAENTAISRAKEQDVRLRVQIDADGDPSSQQYKLQYRRSGNTEWIDVEP